MANDLSQHTNLSSSDIRAVMAINERAEQEPGKGADIIQGGHRYPGEAVLNNYVYDEL